MERKLWGAFYRADIEGILTYYISVFYAGCTAADKEALQRVIKSAEKISCPLRQALPHHGTSVGRHKPLRTPPTLGITSLNSYLLVDATELPDHKPPDAGTAIRTLPYSHTTLLPLGNRQTAGPGALYWHIKVVDSNYIEF